MIHTKNSVRRCTGIVSVYTTAVYTTGVHTWDGLLSPGGSLLKIHGYYVCPEGRKYDPLPCHFMLKNDPFYREFFKKYIPFYRVTFLSDLGFLIKKNLQYDFFF